MAEVAITVNNQPYKIACDDGQESHLLDLAEYVGKRVDQLAAAVGDVGDRRLLVMTCLLIADELSDAFRENETLRAAVEAAPGAGGQGGRNDSLDAATLGMWAERIEKIAQSFERS